QCVGVAKVDLVLTRAALVVTELDGDAEVLEHAHRTAPEVVCRAPRHVVEVSRRVDRLRALGAVLRALQQVELDLGVRVEGEATIRRLREGALEHVAGVGDGGLAVGRGDVTEHAGRRVHLVAPRQDLERRRVRVGQNVRLVGAGESLDGRSVETEPLGEGSLDLRRGYRHRLQSADDIREPEPDELDPALFDSAKNEVTLLVHWLLIFTCRGRGQSGPKARY